MPRAVGNLVVGVALCHMVEHLPQPGRQALCAADGHILKVNLGRGVAEDQAGQALGVARSKFQRDVNAIRVSKDHDAVVFGAICKAL